MNIVSKRIRKVYQDSDGDWCYEKGKAKEVKLLKEACEALDWTARMNDKYWLNWKAAEKRIEELENNK